MPPVGRRKHWGNRVLRILFYKEILLGSGQMLKRIGTIISCWLLSPLLRDGVQSRCPKNRRKRKQAERGSPTPPLSGTPCCQLPPPHPPPLCSKKSSPMLASSCSHPPPLYSKGFSPASTYLGSFIYSHFYGVSGGYPEITKQQLVASVFGSRP